MIVEKPTPFVPKLRFAEFDEAPEWEEITLGALLDRPPEYGVNAAAVAFSESLPTYIRITDISDDGQFEPRGRVSVDIDASDGQYLEDGDIVLARTGASVGKSYRYREEDGRLVYAGFLIRVRPNPKRLLSQFLGAYLSTWSYWDWVRLTSARSGQPGINGTEYASMPLPLPPGERSLAEQQKIADCLGSLGDLIAAERRKLEALRQHKQGLMQQLFPPPGETVPHLGNQSDWILLDLSEVAFFQEGPGIMAADFCTDGVPLVRLSGLAGTIVTLDGCDYLNPTKVAQKWEHFRLVAGDLLISTSASFGRVSIVTEVAVDAVFYTGLVRFRSKDKRLSNGYLKAYLESPDFLRQVECHAVGGGIKHFGPTHLNQMHIQVPPCAEQRQIAECLSCLDACIDGQSRKLDTLKQHKHGLLQQLFPSLEGL